MVLDAALVTGRDENAGSLLFARSGLGDDFALHLAGHHGRGFARGLRFDTQCFSARVIGLPGRIDDSLIPANRACLSESHVVETVIIPRHENALRENKIQTLSVGEALGELLSACFLANGKPLDAGTLMVFVDWLSQRQRFSVDISDYETASEALTVYLDMLPVELELTSAT